ncbi:unnamed protein product [Euphydryas editha]|uniref:Uncharacterized protein n=1 Tax=Euphydryas editha TaxID=104508 RepID=A0AAU9V4M9_EUPED|nr:unnamed protein product [Euphydryas editha]
MLPVQPKAVAASAAGERARRRDTSARVTHAPSLSPSQRVSGSISFLYASQRSFCCSSADRERWLAGPPDGLRDCAGAESNEYLLSFKSNISLAMFWNFFPSYSGSDDRQYSSTASVR